jgi:hypothetical protein
VRAVTREWQDLVVSVLRQARRRGPAAFPVTVVATSSVMLLAVMNAGPAGHHFIRAGVDEYARLPLRTALERLVPSFAAPTARLPYWGAILQVAVVFGIAEALYGSRLTAAVALAAHCVATLSARAFIWLGPHLFFGMVAVAARYADSGPSGATVGLMAFLVVRRRSAQGFVLLSAFLVGEWMLKHGLAQREHVIAALVGALIGVVVHMSASSTEALPISECISAASSADF